MRTFTYSRFVLVALLFGCDSQPDADSGPSAPLDAALAEDSGQACERNSDCDDGEWCNGTETCTGAGCVVGTAPCSEGERCDEAGQRCQPLDCAGPEMGDYDGDGFASEGCGGTDCDDDDPERFPGNGEICDADDHDEDCDLTTYGFRDSDMDGEPDARCCNGDNCGSDCDDMRPGVNPTVPEVCGNDRDDDCDGMMDEGLSVDAYVDADDDGWGDGALPMVSVCPGDPGYATREGDCDESDASINPGATDSCDRLDNDCDGSIDEGLDTIRCYSDGDRDGFGVDSTFMDVCGGCPPGWASSSGDCADHVADAFPGQTRYFPRRYDADPSISIIRLSGDWNCDGSTALRWSGLTYACSSFSCRADSGWHDGTVPECGVSEGYRTCMRDSGSCLEDVTTRTQECR